ncbi:MAG: PAS domain S-box protein [Acidimicrobiia bacterium]|nr:PAS domain S-box protein [Acidimicrobiia bacterium]
MARSRAAGVVAASAPRWVLGAGNRGSMRAVLRPGGRSGRARRPRHWVRFRRTPAFEELVGYDEDDLAGAPFTDLLVVDDLIGVVLQIRTALDATRGVHEVDVALQHRGGESTSCTLVVSRVVDGEATSLLLLATRIGDRRS